MGNWEMANGGVCASRRPAVSAWPPGAIRGPRCRLDSRRNATTPPPRKSARPSSPARPDFVVEIRSRTDNLAPLQIKMQLWMDGGARLGWLIDPPNRRVYIYRVGQAEPEALEDPEDTVMARTCCPASPSACDSTSSTCNRGGLETRPTLLDPIRSRRSAPRDPPALDQAASRTRGRGDQDAETPAPAAWAPLPPCNPRRRAHPRSCKCPGCAAASPEPRGGRRCPCAPTRRTCRPGRPRRRRCP